jgi:hypothetical protein
MGRVSKIAGFAACLLAVLVLSGGHWFMLQSIAWGRMIADFSRQDTFSTAVAKTFSGKHPCPLCLKVRAGWQQEKQREQKLPWEKLEKLPEPLWELHCASLPAPPTGLLHEHAFVPSLHSDFIESPPAPPPRSLFATL